MMTSYLKLLPLLVLLAGGCHGYLRVCYFANWAQYQSFTVSMIDPFACTHIIYAFAKLVGTQVQDIEWNDRTIQGQVMALKNTNPDLKVLLAIGGWTADNSQYVNLVANEANMNTFADNAIAYLRQRGFDGLDLDWEYPGNTVRGSTAADRARFTRWIQILQSKFIAEGGNNRLLLAAATAASMPKANTYYDVGTIGNYLDFVNLMSYDFHGGFDAATHGAQHHSALYPETDSAVSGWLDAGFPANKLVMGMGAYGRGYILTAQPTGTGVGATTTASDIQKYKDICAKVNTGYRVVSITSQSAVAAVGQKNGQWEWIGFDNADTFRTKALYIQSKGLAGSMVWSLDQDDATGACGAGRYPLLSTLQALLPATVTQNPITTTPPPTITTRRPWIPLPTIYPVSPSLSNFQCFPIWRPPPYCVPRTTSVPGDDASYYYYCIANVFAIQCKCYNTMFYNPCKQACDFRVNYFTCPLMLGK